MFLGIAHSRFSRFTTPPLALPIYLLLCGLSTLALDYSDEYEAQPYFIPQPNNFTYNVGQKATLLCSIENLGKKFVVWRKSSDPHPISVGEDIYPQDTRYSVVFSKERREYHLIIENVQPNDGGVYVCQVSSREQLIRPVLLKVIGQPSDFANDGFKKVPISIPPYAVPEIVMSGREFVKSGDTVKLMCNVTGSTDIPQDIDWFKDGLLLRPHASSKIAIRKDTSIANRKLDSVLEIKDSRLEDSGIYVCRNSETLIASQKVIILNEGKSNPGKRGAAGEAKSGQMCNRQWWTMLLCTFLSAIVTDGFGYLR